MDELGVRHLAARGLDALLARLDDADVHEGFAEMACKGTFETAKF
jgi:hypothetical protein